jgi:hypothetical protein
MRRISMISRKEACDYIIVSASAEEGIQYKYRIKKDKFKYEEGEFVRGKCARGEGLWVDGEVFLTDYDDERRPKVDCMVAMDGKRQDRNDEGLALGGPLSWTELPGKIIMDVCEMFRRKGRAKPTTHDLR